MRLKKLIGLLHLWLGLLSGLVIFIVAFTGALYVFQQEIDSFIHRNDYFVTRQDRPQASLSVWLNSADSAFKKFPGQTGNRSISWVNNSNHVVSVHANYKEYEAIKTASVVLNPYSGEVVEQTGKSSPDFWGIVVELHTSLMLGVVGKYIVDLSTLITLILLISGIVLWWPDNKNAARQRFLFRWKKGFSWKRKNYDLHNILGFYASWIAVFLVITGLTMCYGWVYTGIYFILSGKQPVEYKSPAMKNDTTKTRFTQAELAFDKAIQLAPEEYKTAGTCYLEYPSDTSGTIYTSFSFNPKGISELEYRAYVFDRVSLQLIEGTGQRHNAGDWYSVYYARIHYGSIFGLPSKLLAFFASIILASLPVTGFMIWWGRKKIK